jgi:hypothetical protein
MVYEEPEEYEWEKFVVLGLVIVIGGLLTWGIIYTNHLIASQPLIKQCSTNPSILHAQACTTQADCLEKCVARLQLLATRPAASPPTKAGNQTGQAKK